MYLLCQLSLRNYRTMELQKTELRRVGPGAWRACRIRAGLAQAEVSRRTGIHVSLLSRFENSRYVLPGWQLAKLAGCYHTAGWFIDATGSVLSVEFLGRPTVDGCYTGMKQL